MILVLPGLFGFVLIGEGITKCVRQDMEGVAILLFGILFEMAIWGIYFFFAAEIRQV